LPRSLGHVFEFHDEIHQAVMSIFVSIRVLSYIDAAVIISIHYFNYRDADRDILQLNEYINSICIL